MRAPVLAVTAAVPLILGAAAFRCAVSGDAGGAVMAGWMAALTGVAWWLRALSAWEERPGWTRAEKAALKGWMDLEGLLSATPAPREGERQ